MATVRTALSARRVRRDRGRESVGRALEPKDALGPRAGVASLHEELIDLAKRCAIDQRAAHVGDLASAGQALVDALGQLRRALHLATAL